MDLSKLPTHIRLYSDILEEGLQYIQDRRLGKIKSVKTPWDSLNKAGVGGLEWGSMLTIGARPGEGKTMFVTQMIRESRLLNPTQDFNILEFQFEMGPKQTAARDFAAQTALDYDVVLSTGKQLDQFSYGMMQQYVNDTQALQKQGVIRTQINRPCTAKEIEKNIHFVYNYLECKPLIVTIDHSWLIKKDAGDREKINTLYNSVEMLMQVKKDLPIIVLMISQLNRDIDDSSRKIPGDIVNYPTSSDIFGGDALMQGSDMVLVLRRPMKANIQLYGPKQFVVHKEDVFGHVLKSRNGSEEDNIVFMKGDMNKQRIYECPSPVAQNPTGTFTPRTKGGQGRSPRTDADINI